MCALEARVEVETLKKVVSHSVATDFAKRVLPVWGLGLGFRL